KNSGIKILFVEDDRTAGKALAEAFSRAGFDTKVCHNATNAKRVFQTEDFHLVIADCMLPGENGVVMSESFREIAGDNFELVLTSGVFKASSFARDSIARTGAKHFFNKPFDLNEFLEACLELISGNLEEENDPLFELVSEEAIGSESMQNAIENTGTIQGSDLILLYNFLSCSELSGRLQLVTNTGVQSSVDFYNGSISNVKVADKKSYFGILLIENGFTSAQDVQEHLAQDNDKPIGLRLVESHTISPHAIQVVLKQQMSIRLSKTIQEESYEFTFEKHETPIRPLHMIEPSELAMLTNDWIDSKLNRDSLLRFYIPWMEYKVLLNDNKNRFEQLKDLPILRVAPQIFKHIEKNKSLHELMALSDVSDLEFLSVIHFLVLQKMVVFSNKAGQQRSLAHRMKYLESLAEGIEEKDYFQVLGLNQEARDKEIERAYFDLAKIIHPDKLERNAPDELKELTHHVFSKVNKAYETLKLKASREKYLKKLSMGDAEELLDAEQKVADGEALIRRGEYSKAYKLFKEVFKMKSHRSDVPILLTWALLKAPTPKEKAKTIAKTAQALLKKIPPEDRHQPRFFLAKGLYYSFIGQHDKATQHFVNAYTADPSLIEARREMIRAQRKAEQSHDRSKTLITKILKKMG
ncbi:MAG: DnaJ domain-containing protein, partial [Bdellovibrionales bacterium]|nr:DnaJ domain-containing protein [Bdellovibrionales bacterium]